MRNLMIDEIVRISIELYEDPREYENWDQFSNVQLIEEYRELVTLQTFQMVKKFETR